MENNVALRQAICETLMDLAADDKDIVVLVSDSRGSAGMAPFAKAFPQQFIEVGIAEQNIVGIAAGLAACGKKPVVASPASFLSMRSAEQVKVDVAYSQTKVILLGISGGISYGALGMTHHSLQDIALMRSIPGIDVIIPADRYEAKSVFVELMQNPRPAYVRVGRNPVPDVYTCENTLYVAGQAAMLQDGEDAAIIACGETVRVAYDAALELLKQGIHVRVLNMHTIKPLDTLSVLKAADTGFVLTVEEHSVYGGLGGAVSEVLCQNKPVKIQILGIPDEPAIAGTSSQVFDYYGIRKDTIVNIILSNIHKK